MSSRLRVRYWVGVMSKEQVDDAVKKGYCQFKNGDQRPFKQVNPHSWFVYYSPGTKPLKVIREEGREAGKSLRTFTAIGQVLPGEPYSIDLGNGDIVYRRKARYVPNTTDAPLKPLMGELSFLKNNPSKTSWGVSFRSGLIEVLKSDFYRLCEAMNIEMPKRHHLIFEQSSHSANIKQPETQQNLTQPETNDGMEPTNVHNELDSIGEDRELLHQNEASNGKISVEGIQQHQDMEGIQQQQEVNETQQLKVHDDNKASENEDTAVEDGEEPVHNIPNGNEGHETFIVHSQDGNNDDEKENKPIVEDSPHKEVQVPVNGQ